MAVPQTRKVCAFCQRADQKISNEHAWPEWTRNCLAVATDVTVELHRKGNDPKRWTPRDSTGLSINDVCQPCNSGWLHDIEDAVRPTLCPMIKSTLPVTLNADQVTLLSTWAYKTLLIFDLLSPIDQRRFPASDYHDFYASKRPPVTRLVIWFAAYRGSMLYTATDREVTFFSGDRDIKAVPVTYSAGRFAFQVLRFAPGSPSSGVWIPNLEGVWPRRLMLAWPILASPGRRFRLEWPPRQILNDDGMIDLRNRWDSRSDLVLGRQVG